MSLLTREKRHVAPPALEKGVASLKQRSFYIHKTSYKISLIAPSIQDENKHGVYLKKEYVFMTKKPVYPAVL